MAALNELFGKIGFSGFSGVGLIASVVYITLGIVILGLCGFCLSWFLWRRRKWNIQVEFKIPRNIKQVRMKDGSLKIIGTLNKEWGKGFYNAKSGVVLIKRAKKKAVPMKPFDVKKYLSSDNILTVIQVGIEDYRPILDDSYIEVVDEETGEEAALIKAKIDTSEGKSWKNTYERERKNAYSLSSWLKEHGSLLAMGLVVMMILVGFSILWTRIPKVCG